MLIELIPPALEFLEMDGIKKIELAARTCYKSEDKITNDSAEKFVQNVLIKRGHEAMLEHMVVSFVVTSSTPIDFGTLVALPHIHIDRIFGYNFEEEKYNPDLYYYLITGNIRAIRDTIKSCRLYSNTIYLCEILYTFMHSYYKSLVFDIDPTDIKLGYAFNRFEEVLTNEDTKIQSFKVSYPLATYDWINQISSINNPISESLIRDHVYTTVKFTIDRGVSHELVRHRIASFAQESTRYVNYNNKGIRYIRPVWLKLEELSPFMDFLQQSTNAYEYMFTKFNWTPEKSRNLLPNALATEIVVTANIREWQHIFNLRALGVTGKPHPQMSEVMVPLLKAFNDRYPGLFQNQIEQLKDNEDYSHVKISINCGI